MTGGLPNDLPGFGDQVITVYEPEKMVKKEVTVNVIDGDGRTLMPGLIDTHWHTTYASTPAAILLLNQGDMPEVAIRSMTAAKETLLRGFTPECYPFFSLFLSHDLVIMSAVKPARTSASIFLGMNLNRLLQAS